MSVLCSKLRHYDPCISSTALLFCAYRQGGLCNQTGWDKATILSRSPVFASQRSGLLASSFEYIKNSAADWATTFKDWWRRLFMLSDSVYFMFFDVQVSMMEDDGRKIHLFPRISQGVPKQNMICNPSTVLSACPRVFCTCKC